MFGLMAMFVVHLGMGHSLLAKSIKSGTIRRYVAEAASIIVERRQIHQMKFPQVQLAWFHPCKHHGDNRNAPPIQLCIDEIKRWENLPNRREPLTVDMIYHQYGKCISATPHSVDHVLYDFEVIGIYSGVRLGEWAQTDNVRRLDQIRLNIDGTPAAFIISDLTFFGENKYLLSLAAALANPDLVFSVDVCWRFQKNGEIKQKKTFPRASRGNTILCSVCAWLRVAARWAALKLDINHPLAVFTNTGLASGTKLFIRPIHINRALRDAARTVYNITDTDELARFSSHSYRVGATVALHAAGISQMDIKYALRWKSDTFYTYLRNLPCQAARTHAAVRDFNPNIFSLIPFEVVG
jgi:hypothetical protein